MSIFSTLFIRIHIDLQVAQSQRELFRKTYMTILETSRRIRVLFPEQGKKGRIYGPLITVMRSDDLNLIERKVVKTRVGCGMSVPAAQQDGGQNNSRHVEIYFNDKVFEHTPVCIVRPIT